MSATPAAARPAVKPWSHLTTTTFERGTDGIRVESVERRRVGRTSSRRSNVVASVERRNRAAR
eukprot:19209-Pelagococcus_subviridis.AAC.2